MQLRKYLFIIFIVFTSFTSHIFSSNIVIELLVSDNDNQIWKTKNNMHMTIGHLVNVDPNEIKNAIDTFNKDFSSLLENSVDNGFVVKKFNTNGFENGFHILEADKNTTNKFDEINHHLYYYLKDRHNAVFSDKTTPKHINPKGYTPHILFLENYDEKIPYQGDILYFKGCKLVARVQ
jgi:hypothetical protein